MDFSGIVPEFQSGKSISVEKAAMLISGQKEKSGFFAEPPPEFMEEMGKSARFRDAILSDYINVTDEENGTEFAALNIKLNDSTVYVSFRGTGDALIGWREDFSMSFHLTGSQTEAKKYLDTVINDKNIKYRVGGHSKGGNLAVYASMMCPKGKQKQIIAVYNNDGPGICGDIIDIKKYKSIQNKIIRIVPEFSIIGTLFEHENPVRIVSSSAYGILQHDALTWDIEGDRFCEKDSYTKECIMYINIFDKWIGSATMEQREIFTRDFFNALEAGGAKTMSELVSSGKNEFEAILMSIVKSEKKTKIVIGKFIKSIIDTIKSINYNEFFKNKGTIQGTVCIIIGIVFMAFPTFASQFVGMGLGLIALFLLGKLQIDFVFSGNSDLSRTKKRFIIRMILMCIVSFFLAMPDVLTRFTNIILGVLFLGISYMYFRKSSNCQTVRAKKVLCTITGTVTLIIGITAIFCSSFILESYSFIVGICILIYGLSGIVYTVYEKEKNKKKI